MLEIDLNKVPNSPGVYIFKDEKNRILYIGKAKNLKKRLQQYFVNNSAWKVDMLNQASDVEILETDTEITALNLEENLIKQYKPPYNQLLKDNFRYVWIKFTNEEFPQIKIVKRKQNDGAIYIGPKYNNKNLREFLHLFRKVFKFRDCPKTQFNKGELCSDYYFGLCSGWCIFKNDKKKKKEYGEILDKIKSFFEGDYSFVTKYLESEIQKAIDKQNFERAAKLRDLYFSVQKVSEKSDIYFENELSAKFVQIKEYGDFWVFVVLVFNKGRLIDVIIEQKPKDQLSFQQLLIALQLEFGSDIYFFDTANLSLYLYSETFSSEKNKKNLGKNKEELQEVESFDKNGYLKDLESLNLAENGSFPQERDNEVENQAEEAVQKIKLTKEHEERLQHLFQKFFESYLISSGFKKESGILSSALEELKKRYKLRNYPYHIEAIDISHLSGDRVAGGLSCLLGGVPYKNYYRKYKIPLEIVGDDYKSLKYILEKRLSRNPLPDLILIDGGKGQLNILKKLKEEVGSLEEVDFLALKKGEARTRKGKFKKSEIVYGYISGIGSKIFGKEIIYDEIDKILLKARDEAHRFANKYRKELMAQDFKENG